MRIAFVLVLLLIASVRPAWAQSPRLPSALPALPASLTPAASPPGEAPVPALRRNRVAGVTLGAVVGAVAGVLVTNHYCSMPGESSEEGFCRMAGIGLATVLGAIVGGGVGLPDSRAR